MDQPVPRTHNEENASQRQRLYDLTADLNDEKLTRKLKNGWTVATALIHLAFWDQYYAALLEEWERSAAARFPANISVTSRGLNVDAINKGIECISLSVPLHMAVHLVRTAADSIDGKLKGISQDLATAIEESGHRRLLRRAIHRAEHLDQIEQVLG